MHRSSLWQETDVGDSLDTKPSALTPTSEEKRLRYMGYFCYELFLLLNIFTIRLYTISDKFQVYPLKIVVFTN
jgi:hypothetical protein